MAALRVSRNEAMKRLLAAEAEDIPYTRRWWERFGSPAASLGRQEAAERRAAEDVCPDCGGRTIDGQCGVCL